MIVVIDQKEKKPNNYVDTQYNPTVLSYAAQMSLKISGNVDSAYVIKNITCTTPTRTLKYKIIKTVK
jgi:hypothetical protein